ncbi:MAG: hypothetical protein ACE5KM_14685 [Planctomycetaceae bacterium]
MKHTPQKLLIAAGFLLLHVGSVAAQTGSGNFTAKEPKIVRVAERCRADLARYWFGREFPQWAKPCPITVSKGEPAGATRFVIDRGHVFGWQIQVTGPRDRIVDSILPHEVNHTLFATQFRRPLPRWLGEGAAQWVEDEAEHERLRKAVATNTKSGAIVPFRRLLELDRRYAGNGRELAMQYAEGFSIVAYLISEHGGREKFIAFTSDVRDTKTAVAALKSHYGFASPEHMQRAWRKWFDAKSRHGLTCRHFGCRAPHRGILHTEQQPASKPHLLIFGYEGCRYCRHVKRDLQAGKFAAYDWEYVDVGTESGAKRYRTLVAALEKATGRKPPAGFPAFHVAGRASLIVGYAAQSGWRRILDWARETLRLPVTLVDAVTGGNAANGVSPAPPNLTGGAGNAPADGGQPPTRPPSQPTFTPAQPAKHEDEDPLPWDWGLGGIALALAELIYRRKPL